MKAIARGKRLIKQRTRANYCPTITAKNNWKGLYIKEKRLVPWSERVPGYQSNLLNGQAYARTIDGARNAIGSFASSSKVTYSQASCFARTACSSLLFNA